MLRVKNPQVMHPLAETDLLEVVLEFDESDGSFVSHVPALNGITTQGRDYEETLDRTAEMILGYFEACEAARCPIPLPKRTVQQIRDLLA
jgi:predicted RNase H-like HicB family nuclease